MFGTLISDFVREKITHGKRQNACGYNSSQFEVKFSIGVCEMNINIKLCDFNVTAVNVSCTSNFTFHSDTYTTSLTDILRDSYRNSFDTEL